MTTPQTRPPDVTVWTPDGIDRFPDVADVAELTADRIQVVAEDGEKATVNGRIFSARGGTWKLWLDDGNGLLQVDPVVGPIWSFPFTDEHDLIQFEYDGSTHRRGGRIKRLKRADL